MLVVQTASAEGRDGVVFEDGTRMAMTPDLQAMKLRELMGAVN